jgi:hypothetical protein
MSTEEFLNPEVPQKTADEVIAETVAAIESGAVELPPELIGEAPAEEPEQWFKCRRNHVQRGDFYLMAKDPISGEVSWRSGPMCSRCMAEWQAQKFRTRPCKPPEEA